MNATASKVTGSPSEERRISQTIPISGKKDDCYVLAGWAMGYSVPLESLDSHDSDLREFGMIATFNNTDGTTSTNTVRFNPCVEDWQYAASAIVAEKPYNSITVTLAYDYNANEAHFDGIQLYKEQFGISYTYDSDGNVVSAIDLQKQETTYKYDENTNYLEKLAYGNGDSVQYTYDKQGRVTAETYEDGETVEYLYDNDGALGTVIDSKTGTASYSVYDMINRLAQYREVAGNYEASLTYTYDKHNRLTNILESIDDDVNEDPKANKRKIIISYDDDNRVATWRKENARVYYTYDAYSRVSQMRTHHVYTETDVMTETFTFHSPGSGLTSSLVETYRTDSVGDYDVTYSYTYDDNGNILSVDDGTNTTSYVYDSANQLLREDNQAAGTTTVWTYDNAGNIQTRKEYAYTTGTVGTPTDSVTYTYGNSNWGDLLTAYDGQTITYDEIGNPLTDGTWEYTWQHGRELASMTDGTTTWSYTYNADGLRTQRTNGTTTYNYVYLGGQLVKMTVGENTMYFAYDADGTPLSVRSNGTTYYYVTNLQGDVVGIVTSGGRTVVRYTYDAWGNLLSTTGEYAGGLGARNPLRYRGYVYDKETGLYYLQSRYYNPESGRFINADAFVSTGVGLIGNNMFAYCNSSPISYSDNSGQRMVHAHDCGGGTKKDNVIYYSHPDSDSNLDGPADDNHSVYNKLIKPMAKNICISGGLGFGLYTEGELWGMDVGLGTYYDLVAFEWQNGEMSTYQYGYAGVTSTVMLFDVGAETSVLVREDQKPITESWLLYNDQKDSFGIFGVAFYTPMFGGRFEVSFR